MPETKVVLTEKDLPTHWYNIQADLPSPLPPVIHPGTKQPIGPADLAPLFPMELIKQEGVKRITTETGAGQWGSALAFASNAFGLESKVYMVKVSYEQKPYRRIMMETWGGRVVPSPSAETQAGRAILAKHPDSPGSLGIAISEAVEEAANREDTKYSLGSVLNHMLMHQTVIGLETKKQFEILGEYPDILVGCVGGGSSFAGFTFPFIPAPIHAGGLRYHGMAPLVCALYDQKIIEAVAVHQNPVFEAAVQFTRSEGIVPAPEPSHGIRVVIDEALSLVPKAT